MSIFKKYTTIILLLSMLVAQDLRTIAAARETSKEDYKVEVYTYRNFPDPTQNFTIHCRSKDDDLGEHTVTPPYHYMFKFRPSLFGNTLFHCRVQWQGRAVSFVIYNYQRDQQIRCMYNCSWNITPYGAYGFKEGALYPDLVFHWTS